MDLFSKTPKNHCEYIWLWSRQEEPEVQRIRQMLQSWFDFLEDENYKKELIQRFSGNGCHGAFFELFCFHWLTARGFKVIPQDHLPGKTADFLVQDAEGNGLFYLECTVVCDSDKEKRKENFIDEIVAAIKKILPEDVGMIIEFGDIDRQPSPKKICTFIEEKITNWREAGSLERQKFDYQKDGVSFRVKFSQQTGIVICSNSLGYNSLTDSEKIRGELRDKVQKVRKNPSVPFIIASNLTGNLAICREPDANDFTMQQVFLGDYYVTMGTGEGQHDLRTTFWFDAGRRPINTRVGAVMYFANVSPDNTERCGYPVIWHHPKARNRASPPLFKDVPQWVLDESRKVLRLVTQQA